MTLQPTVSEERLMAVGAPTPWKSFSLLPRCGFFVLALICAAALFGFIAAISHGGRGAAVVAGLFALGVAELLILVYRFFGAGLEEALWLSGAVALAGGIAWDGRYLLLVMTAATLAAGIRLLNPLFATAGAIVFAFYVMDVATNHVAAAVCAFLAAVALALLPLPRRRPSVEHTIAALVVVMPLAAYLFDKGTDWRFDWRVAAALLVYAAAALLVGLRFRLHAPLLALFTSLGCFAYEVRELTGMRLETRLIVWGGVLLAVSIAVERSLKTPRHGITSRQLRDDQLGDLLQLAGTVAIAPHQKPAEQGGPRLETGGSSFGGAGAGGDV